MVKIDRLALLFLSVALGAVSCGKSSDVNQNSMAADSSADNIMSGMLISEKSDLSKIVVEVRGYMRDNSGRYASCTGAIVSNDAILTAAHCFSSDTGKVSVVFGISTDKMIEERPALNFKVHEGYPSQIPKYQDLALVRIKGLIPASYHPVRLFSGTDVPIATKLSVLGYGVQTLTPTEADVLAPKKLRAINLQVRYYDNRAAWMFLAMNSKYGVAPGDSGGPLLIKKNGEILLAGIASGYTPEHNPTSAKYTLVEPHKTWIKDTILSLRAAGGK